MPSISNEQFQGDFERGIWFKYKACSLISSGGVLLYVEHWVRLCNAVIGAKCRSNKAFYFFFANLFISRCRCYHNGDIIRDEMLKLKGEK